MTTPPDGPDQPSHGHEYPPLESSPTASLGYPPLDYPTDTGPPPAYPGPIGYPPPGYPQGGYPPLPGAPYPGYPAFDPYGSASPTGTNGKAVASLVTSLVGLSCCGLPGIVGIILGIIAMREVKQTGQEGHGLALAGIIVGAVVIVFMVLALILLLAVGVLDETSSYSSY